MKPMHLSDITAHTGFWMRMVSNHVSHAFAAKLSDKGVTVAEWVLMRTLYGKEPMLPSRVAEAMGMTRGAITKLADRLIAKSLIVREASNNDGRTQTLALTKRGSLMMPTLAELADRNDAEYFDCLTADEKQKLETILRKLVAHGKMSKIPIA